MTIERNPITGAYQCSDIVAGRRVHRQYMGYTKREAMADFKAYCRQVAKES